MGRGLERLTTIGRAPPPPPPLPVFEGDSQKFASVPSAPRGFKPPSSSYSSVLSRKLLCFWVGFVFPLYLLLLLLFPVVAHAVEKHHHQARNFFSYHPTGGGGIGGRWVRPNPPLPTFPPSLPIHPWRSLPFQPCKPAKPPLPPPCQRDTVTVGGGPLGRKHGSNMYQGSHLRAKKATVPVPNRWGFTAKLVLIVVMCVDASNGLLPPYQNKWLEARNLGLLPLGTINMYLVSFHWICGVVTINTYLTI